MGAHIGLLDDPPGLAEHGGGDEDLLADHGVVLVVGVVGVAELAVGAELELEELVPELALVPHVVPQVELAAARGAAVVAAARRHRFFSLSLLGEWIGVLKGVGRRKPDVLASSSLPPGSAANSKDSSANIHRGAFDPGRTSSSNG